MLFSFLRSTLSLAILTGLVIQAVPLPSSLEDPDPHSFKMAPSLAINPETSSRLFRDAVEGQLLRIESARNRGGEKVLVPENREETLRQLDQIASAFGVSDNNDKSDGNASSKDDVVNPEADLQLIDNHIKRIKGALGHSDVIKDEAKPSILAKLDDLATQLESTANAAQVHTALGDLM